MAVSETQRRDLYNGLHELLGSERADILMACLPTDTAHLVTKEDIRELTAKVALLDTGLDTLNRRLDTGLSALSQRLDQGLNAVNQRSDGGLSAMNQRLDEGLSAVNQRLDEGLSAVNQRLDEGISAVNQRLDQGLSDVHRRLDRLFLALIAGLIAFVGTTLAGTFWG